ncbi:TetR/AcrR family transcriptional regulator [Brevundimonas sp. NIBR11]|uniref:TetR/AcrR family transcriptional regulator n=1 Tax=Brevundimonas sp. NIBR11 TaxID=3015999 RepID=UPI0022F07CE8|nr:TetR/AcrR family transcriptional regulator [Brevundimonas sp. NIBR11]WGM31638.1 HTH-type transcriptional repressor ComR [Brevundimonas sp. NIBR11]
MSSRPQPAAPPSRGRPRTFDREQALDAAMRVFWAKGFAGASLSELTAAMGIASPSLYAAFGSKEGLYREAIERYVSSNVESFWGVMEMPTARESVEGLLRNAARAFSTPGAPPGCMVLQTATEGGELSPELADSLCEMRASNAETLARRLRRGIGDGDVAPGTDVRAVADFYATVHKGLSLSAKGGAGADELNSVVTSAMAAWAPLTQVGSDQA